MKSYPTFFRSALSILSLSYATISFAGAISGGGGDVKLPETGAAWFLGQAQHIRTCFELDPGFGASEVEVRQAIRDAAQLWDDYFREKHLNEMPHYRSPHSPVPTSTPTLYADMTIAHELDLGPCDQNTELKLYFGTTGNPEVDAARAHFERPISFAHRTSYDRQQGRGRGFIWVAKADDFRSLVQHHAEPGIDTYHRPRILSGILAHEFGHMYGCDHFDGTIMDEDLARRVIISARNPEHAPQLLGQIDDLIELFPCLSTNCPRNYVGSPELPSNGRGQVGVFRSAAVTFRLFTGRDSVGTVRTELRGTNRSDSEIILSDQIGSVHFPLQIGDNTPMARFSSAHYAFSTYRESFLNPQGVYVIGSGHESRGAQGAVAHFSARLPSGRRVRMVYEYNSESGNGPVRIRYFDGEELYDLLNMGRLRH